MEKNSVRAKRRHESFVHQKKRLKNYSFHNHEPLTDEQKGQLKDNHFGCGCSMCKPWKHNLEESLTASERRKITN